MSDVLFSPLGLLVLLVISYAAIAIVRAVATRQRRRTRVVERPNSHHTWQRVLERETRTRWDEMPLEQLHPLNRDEVIRLLARVRAAGMDSLRPREREFLDRMAELAGSPPPPLRTPPQPPVRPEAAPDLHPGTT